MRKTVHYVDGCPWADGHIHSADTRQTRDWAQVTCKHCKRNYGYITIRQEYESYAKRKAKK